MNILGPAMEHNDGSIVDVVVDGRQCLCVIDSCCDGFPIDVVAWCGMVRCYWLEYETNRRRRFTDCRMSGSFVSSDTRNRIHDSLHRSRWYSWIERKESTDEHIASGTISDTTILVSYEVRSTRTTYLFDEVRNDVLCFFWLFEFGGELFSSSFFVTTLWAGFELSMVKRC